MRILVTGGRDLGRYYPRQIDWLWSVLDDYLIHHLIVGDARGADASAQEWAIERNIPYSVYVADWEGQGKAAGPIRNQVMLDAGRPEFVVAFPGGKGTADMLKRAERANVQVQRYSIVDYHIWVKKNEQ